MFIETHIRTKYRLLADGSISADHMNFNITNNVHTNSIVNGDVQTNLYEFRHNVLYLDQQIHKK